MNTDIRAIFFDLGGTFRILRENKPYTEAAKARMAQLCGTDMDAIAFHRLIDSRYDSYRQWALTYQCEAPEEVLWTRWLAPDFDKERICAAAGELTGLYRQAKGERLVVEGGVETVRELCRRGYALGIISDLVGTAEIDRWLDEDGLRPYFKAVQQSSITYVRKPHPAIYFNALQEAGEKPGTSAFVGDNLARDILGAKVAGFGMTIAVSYPGMPALAPTAETLPDAVITSFPQLLDIFPACGQAAAQNMVRWGEKKT
ncbi:MAG: HAD family hydrolase [Christensenellales bacterium]